MLLEKPCLLGTRAVCGCALAILSLHPLRGFSANPGDLLITEVMRNPQIVEDVTGEWFEVYNRTDAPLDLLNWTVSDPGNFDPQTLASSSLVVPARSYFLFAASGDSGANGGLPPVDVVFGDRIATYRLLNSTDGLEIRDEVGTPIDAVLWDDGIEFPDPGNAGASMQFVGGVDAPNSHLVNDLGDSWSRAEIPYGDGDRGTPRQGLDEFPPAIGFVPSETLDFGRTNLTNLPLPIRKDIDFQNNGGGTLSILAASITVGDATQFSLAGSFTQVDVLPGKRGNINIVFDDAIFETRTYTAQLDLSTNLAAPNDVVSVTLTAEVVLSTNEPVAGAVVVNEFSYDPQDAGVANDYNGDGMGDGDDDEFVELYNTLNRDIDISGWSIDDDNIENENTFVFPVGTILPARGFVVVFGGGTPTHFPIQTFIGLPPLGNGGDQIWLNDGFIDHDSVGFEDGATGTMHNLTVEADGGVIARQLDGSNIFESRDPQFATIGRTNDLSVPTPTPTNTSEPPTPTPTPTQTASPTPMETRSADFDGDGEVDAIDLLVLLNRMKGGN